MAPELFDRSRLSARESAILDAAIEGMTDIQISQKLDISQSTVNSYWVRIRGKLGQLSRTELVALALKAQAQTQMEAVNAELSTLRTQANAHAQQDRDFANAEVFRAALDAMPEAVLVCCDAGVVRYANGRLEAMFGYDKGELIGRPAGSLLPTVDREGDPIVEYMKDPHPTRIGFDRVVYGRRKNGALFRIVLLLDARPVSSGAVCACLIRDFTSEIETRRAHASSWS